ncbi:MAG: RIP metalloprotease RseP [Succinivibrionaceae bacterium]|nr:RIP metalloprotease RseP [Succinivibrionaceae bacterium]
MEIIRSLFFFLVAIIVLVGFHEFGHFITARLCGVKVLRFSLGFGKVIFAKTGSDGCEYAISLIPLGGYVKMLDRREGEVKDEEAAHEFTSQSVWKRLAIVAAGPVFNIILAFFLYWAMYVMGVAAVKPYLTGIIQQSAAWEAGLRNDDLILEVDGREVADWEDAIYELIQHVGDEKLELKVRSASGIEAMRSLDISGWSIHRDQMANVFSQLGFNPKYFNISNRIAAVMDDSPARKAGLEAGDEILSVDGRSMASWYDFSDYVAKHPGATVNVRVSRPLIPDGAKPDDNSLDLDALPSDIMDFSVSLTSVGEGEKRRGQIGVAAWRTPLDKGVRFVRKYGPFEAAGKSLDKMVAVCRLTVVTIGKLISGSIPADNISGPIAIAKSAGITAEIGIEYFLGFMALISINLGIMNLFPLPVLDGGHIMFYAIEAAVRRPLPDKVMQWLMYFGIFVLLLIMVLAVYNDLVYD